MALLTMTSDGQRLTLSGAATIEDAEALREHLLSFTGGTLEVDLQALEELDVAAAQVLLAARRTMPAMTIVGCPAALKASLVSFALEAAVGG